MPQVPEFSTSSASAEPAILHARPQAPGAGREAPRVIQIGQTVADVERHLILDTLAFFQGNRTRAAKILGISIRTLRNKLNEYMEAGIAVPEPGQPRPAAAA